LTPAELMHAILLAPVDLLWNGGIGTYVKATTESDADAADKANDAIRVNGADLRARCVGEGGNLGLTPRGRIEYAVQGCGHVGYYLASNLRQAGARLIASDVDAGKVERVVKEFGAVAVAPDEIYGSAADIFAPCALGGIINDQTIPQLKVEVIVGGANNQLLEMRHGDDLHRLGLLYAPDYAANSGGVINGCRELLGWETSQSAAKVDEIYDTLLDIFRVAETEGIPTYKAADRLAERRFQNLEW